MKEESQLKLGFKALLVFLIFLVSSFSIAFLFFGFNNDATCPKCNGTGQVWEKRYDFTIDTYVTGYWPCFTCGGSGTVYFPSSASYGLGFFFGFVIAFLIIFALDYGVTTFRLDWNPWVKDVEEMRFWFNPMYFVWLFDTNRKKWAKWTTALSLIAAILIVSMFAMPLIIVSTPAAHQNIFFGWLIGMTVASPFALVWYQNC